MPEEFSFEFNGRRVTARKFGPTYIAEFQRVVRTYVPAGARNILEWGSGLTTLVLSAHAQSLPDVKLFLTIDNEPGYQDAIFAQHPRPPFLRTRTLDLTGPRKSGADPQLAYSTFPLRFERKFDFIFIDGRRRMECAFIASILSHAATVVVIHDYRRARYQPVLALFESVEDGEEFRVLRARPSVLSAMSEGIAEAEANMRRTAEP
jgi:hypothetical protein